MCMSEVSVLLTKKGSIFFTLAIVKDAGIDQGMLDQGVLKNATLTDHISFKKDQNTNKYKSMHIF